MWHGRRILALGELRVNLVILGPEGSKTLNFLRRPGSAHIFFALMVENNFVSI